MNFGILVPIAAILATAWVIVTALRYKHGRRSVWEQDPTQQEMLENARLAQENEGLKRTVQRLEERMAVLERIATDPAERTAREIEQLRQD